MIAIVIRVNGSLPADATICLKMFSRRVADEPCRGASLPIVFKLPRHRAADRVSRSSQKDASALWHKICMAQACQRLRRLTLYQVHAHDTATGHYIACDWRLTVYERILLARARELRY